MFDLVADVESYPDFVPLCERLKVRERGMVDGNEIITARMTVAYKLIRESFISKAVFDRENLQIRAEYLEGPFRQLENRWTFHPREDGGCDVEFFISYEFKSKMLEVLMGSVFDKAFRKFSKAFEMRADEIYSANRAVSV